MTGTNKDFRADISADLDRGETTFAMEPLVLSEGSRHRTALTDLSIELVAASAGLRRSLPEPIASALSQLVRAMNCYYSNLIEGHHSHPIDVERAMHNDYSADPVKRNLQLEARAHVAVQRWVDDGGVRGRTVTTQAICEIHRRFCELLPKELLVLENPATGRSVDVTPGALRADDVQVGEHVAISPGAVPRFLKRFEEVYGALGRSETILAAAAAHHRLLWIHPFADGNGRVARLVSHSLLLEALDSCGLWSVARGLARSVASYKAHLMNCDTSRRNDLDGRGALSEEALAAFTQFFLETCIDQVHFMEGLVEPARLRDRVLLWAEEETRAGVLPPRSRQLLEAILYRGALSRGEVAAVLATGERQARRIVSELLARGVLTSDGPRGPLVLAFPATLAGRWMPGLFPEQTTQ